MSVRPVQEAEPVPGPDPCAGSAGAAPAELPMPLPLPRRRLLARLLWGAAAWRALPGVAQAPATEASVKAAYLYKFMAYIEWPPSSLPPPGAPMTIAVAGSDIVHWELQAMLAGRQVNGHPVVARRLAEGEVPENAHVVFVSRARNLQRIAERLRGRPVLVISDVPDGLEHGAMLNFVHVDGRVRFEAAPLHADRSELKLGSRLLAVAERVVR